MATALSRHRGHLRPARGLLTPSDGHCVNDAHSRASRRKDPHGTRRQDQNKTEELTGKAKEAAGKATDDESLEAEGKGDQAKANLKQAGEKVKDAFKH